MDERRPLVSIVIPTYNHARYLEEAVESVLARDYPSIELLVFDDVSKDNTRRERLGQDRTLGRNA